MAKDGIYNRIEEKIDRLHEKVNNTNIKVAKIEQHLSDINGSVKRQQQNCMLTTRGFDDRIKKIEGNLKYVAGGAAMLGVVLSVVAKAAGLW